MQILVINGNSNPKPEGFIHGALGIVTERLEKRGAKTKRINLAEANIHDCLGCFNCLKTGECIIKDDMGGIISDMLAADGFVIGSPVRNSLMTACYKRFYERITYLLGFSKLLKGKQTMAISCVGYASGKAANKRALGLQQIFETNLSSYTFASVGIPTKRRPEDYRKRLERAADKLITDIEHHQPAPLFHRLSWYIDRVAMRKLMFEKSPETYAFIIDSWKKQRYM